MLYRTLIFCITTANSGLIDKPGGERDLLVGVDDTLLKQKVRHLSFLVLFMYF